MNVERLNKLLEDIDNALYDLKICQCNINITAKGHKWETYYGLDDDLIKYIRKIESSNKNLQSKIDKAIELIERKLSTETYQHLKKLYDDIDSTEEIWEDYEFEDLRDILKEDKK